MTSSVANTSGARSRKLLPWLALGLVVLIAVVVLVVRSRPDNSPTARAYRLEHQLACPVCEGQAVFDSNSPQAAAIRDDIPKRIAAGQSDGEIRAAYVALYNEKILETPSNSGLNIVVWALPVLALHPRCRRCRSGGEAVEPDAPPRGDGRGRGHRAQGPSPRGRGMSDSKPRSGTPDVEESHEQLEDERDFLLRSLDDLDRELVAGNIDPDTYRVLHDDYTARASAVIRSLTDGVDRQSPDAPRVPPLMRLLTIGGIVVFAVLAAILLAHAIGQRNPGQQITGDSQTGGTPTTSATSSLASAAAAAKAAPSSYPAQIAYARAR